MCAMVLAKAEPSLAIGSTVWPKDQSLCQQSIEDISPHNLTGNLARSSRAERTSVESTQLTHLLREVTMEQAVPDCTACMLVQLPGRLEG